MTTPPAVPVVLIAVARERSLMRVLGPTGYSVLESATASRALERARDTRPDIIILDNDLPDLTGLEACRLFRGEPHIGRNVPILLLTSGLPSPDQRVTALRAGVWDFLQHPGDHDALSLKLETYIQQHSQAEFSHGMCPDCLRRLYPEYADAVTKRSRL